MVVTNTKKNINEAMAIDKIERILCSETENLVRCFTRRKIQFSRLENFWPRDNF